MLEVEEKGLADRRDRALLHETVLGVLRNRRRVDAVLARASDRPLTRLDGPVLAALRVGVYSLLWLDRVPDHAAVATAVEAVQRSRPRAAGYVNGVLRTVAGKGREWIPERPANPFVADWSVWASHPDWWVERLVRRVGWETAIGVLEADNRPARTTLRTNLARISAERLAAMLAASGCRTRPGRVVAGSLRVHSGNPGDALSRGLCWVQDEASQLVSELVAARAGMRVLDCCAAPGGKALQLANAVGPSGSVLAVDRHAGRMRRLTANVQRCGFEQVQPVIADMTGVPPFDARFERILVDAPCSGTGTLRRHPEIRWRLTPEAIKLFSLRQGALLDRAADLLAAGGRLVYSVCSMEPEEGQGVIASFLERNPQLSVLDPAPELSAAARTLVGADGFVRTSPAADGLDGFFAAVLKHG